MPSGLPQRRARRKKPAWALVILALISWGGASNVAGAADEAAVSFETRPQGLQIRVGTRPIATYRFEDGSIIRPFFEHVQAPDGMQVTRNHPPVAGKDIADHPAFHPGVWMAFGDLNGADSWRNKDRIRHVEFVEGPQGGPGRGTFAVKNHHEAKGRAIAEEVSHITILVRPSGYLLLWDSKFRPLGDPLLFGDQEEMGLGVRMATSLAGTKGGQLHNSEGLKAEAQVWGKTAAWCAYDGTLEGDRVGVALMPHPKNFRPSWFHARDYGLLVANPFGRNAFTQGEKSQIIVKSADPLRLRFGALFYSIPAGKPLDLPDAYQDYLGQAGLD